MRNKPIWTALLMCLSLLFTAGCLFDPVQDDLIAYINDRVKPLAPLEAEAMDAYDSVTGVNYKNDAETLTVIRDTVMPKYRDFITKLEAVQTDTPEVRAAHEIYIAAANKQYNAMVQITAALEQQDVEMIHKANEMLDEGRKGLRDYQNQLRELADAHGVTLAE
ncbi:hypothetical protein [Brevibacillus dissolubilis]|uniref:hypothetical protein n=1 Tax=Brevibacillus dissolubilis TaxID=1844116 RepID=UPI002100071E|nr:hypothetical protein [Brevibacillus dissolubilis]